MTSEQGNKSSQHPEERQLVPIEIYEDLREEYVILRRALRDCLGQAGIRSNPGWTDLDIVASVAKKLGVQNRYQHAVSFTLRQREQNRQQNPGNL